MSSITMEVHGLEEFTANVHQAASQIRPLISQAMSKSVNQIKGDAQDLAPFITGTLRRSILAEVQNDGLLGIVYGDRTIAPYARAIEFGTEGMTINVPNGRRIKGGRTRPYSFTGNIKPHLYLTQAFEKNTEVVKEYFQDAVTKILQIAGGKT